MAVGKQIGVLMFSNYIKKSCTVKGTFGIQNKKLNKTTVSFLDKSLIT